MQGTLGKYFKTKTTFKTLKIISRIIRYNTIRQTQLHNIVLFRTIQRTRFNEYLIYNNQVTFSRITASITQYVGE